MIGENITKARKKKRLTLSELADRAGISKSYLSNLERNLNINPSIQIIEKIATVLEVDLEAILGLKYKSPNYVDEEWVDFVNQLKEYGIKKDELSEYKLVIEFIKWKNEQKVDR